MSKYISENTLKKLLSNLKSGGQIDHAAVIQVLESLDAERIMLRSMDREAATHVESVICMRTDFDGDKETGWKGLGSALNRALDERDHLRKIVSANVQSDVES